MNGITETDEPVNIYNPLLTDFSYIWLDDNNAGHTLMIPSLQIASFPSAQGNFMAKHLTDAIDQERGGRESDDIRREKIMKEIIK